MRCAALVLMVFAVAGCHDPLAYTVASGPRDWSAHPAIVSLPAAATLYAASDIHGGYDRVVPLLVQYKLIDAAPSTPDAVHWTGGTATLVVTGDMIDKGPKGLEVIELIRALQMSAAMAGGAVVVTLGNHEAEFFADPTNSKAQDTDGLDGELGHDGVDLVAFASGEDPRGLWLREQPFGARIGGWFFAHAGYTQGRTLDALDQALRAGFDANDFRDAELIGSNSLLEARDWYNDSNSVAMVTQGLGVDHVVFGHTPSALGPRGAIAMGQQGAVFRIDCGMSPDVDDSHGALLRVQHDASGDVAQQLAADGSVTELWRKP